MLGIIKEENHHYASWFHNYLYDNIYLLKKGKYILIKR